MSASKHHFKLEAFDFGMVTFYREVTSSHSLTADKETLKSTIRHFAQLRHMLINQYSPSKWKNKIQENQGQSRHLTILTVHTVNWILKNPARVGLSRTCKAKCDRRQETINCRNAVVSWAACQWRTPLSHADPTSYPLSRCIKLHFYRQHHTGCAALPGADGASVNHW